MDIILAFAVRQVFNNILYKIRTLIFNKSFRTLKHEGNWYVEPSILYINIFLYHQRFNHGPVILCLSKKHVTTQNIKKCYINTTIIYTDISSPQISLMFEKLKYWVLVYKNLVLKEIPKTCIWHSCDFLVTLKKWKPRVKSLFSSITKSRCHLLRQCNKGF